MTAPVVSAARMAMMAMTMISSMSVKPGRAPSRELQIRELLVWILIFGFPPLSLRGDAQQPVVEVSDIVVTASLGVLGGVSLRINLAGSRWYPESWHRRIRWISYPIGVSGGKRGRRRVSNPWRAKLGRVRLNDGSIAKEQILPSRNDLIGL